MKPRIFISAVTSEFKTARQLVANVLQRLGYDPVTQDIFGTESGDLRQMLRDKIDDCDGLIQLIGRGYGAEPPTVCDEFAQDGFTRVSYTQFEFLYARARGKRTWLIFADDGCTFDHPLEERDLPHDPKHPDSVGDQAERRALQEAWRQRWKQEGHLHHGAANNTELELKVERLKDEFAELRRAEHAWRRKVAWSLAAVVVVVMIVLGAVSSIRWQRQVERDRAAKERLAQEQERERQGREREKQENERLAAEAARRLVLKNEQADQKFADRFLHQLLANKEIKPEDARERAIKELPALVDLPLDEVLAIIDRRFPASTIEAPVSPLERARADLTQRKYEAVVQAEENDLLERREMAMLAGTAALALFRESPNPKWNDRAVAAFGRALALSDKGSKDWTDAAISSASVLYELARYAEAEPLLVESQRILMDRHGKESSEVVVPLTNLGQLLQATNRLAEAEPLMRLALAIQERTSGPMSNVAVELNNLAALLNTTERPAEAESLMRRALAIDESYGTRHSEVAVRLNNLAALLLDTNRPEEAEPLVRRALTIDEHSSGTSHPRFARDLNNLGQVLARTNRSKQAEAVMRQAFSIDEQVYGTEHPLVASDLNNLAMLIMDTVLLSTDTARLAKAEPMMHRSVAIMSRLGRRIGHEHSDMPTFTKNYRALLQAMAIPEDMISQRLKDAAEAVGPIEPIAPQFDRILGPVPSLVETLAVLDRQYSVDKKPAIFFLKPDQPITPHIEELLRLNAASLTVAGVMALKNGDNAYAVVLLDESIRLQSKNPETPDVQFSTRMNRAAARRELGDVNQACEELRTLLSEYDTSNTINPIALGRARYHLALCEWRQNGLDAAERDARESLKAFGDNPALASLTQQSEKLLGDLKDSIPAPVVDSTKMVAAVEQARARFLARVELATLPLDESALPLLDKMLGPPKPTKPILDELERQYMEQGKPAI